MHDNELAVLRRELAATERGPGKVYSDELRARLIAWARRRVATGETVASAARAVAVDRRTLRQWLAAVPPDRARADGAKADRAGATGWRPPRLVPVEIVAAAALSAPTTVTLVSPSGYRIEGLSIDDALRALARLR